MSSQKSVSCLRLPGWLLVAAWLAALPGVLPVLFAAIAWVDGEHGVQVQGTADDVRVILTHGTQNQGKLHDQIHHHRLLGQLLTCCAASPGGQPDHVMQFRGAKSGNDDAKRTIAPTQGESDVTIPPVTERTEIIVVVPEPKEAPHFRTITRCGALLPQLPGLQHSLLI